MSTRVLAVQPSRTALAEALGGAAAPIALVRITREVLPPAPDSLPAAQRPRARVTIAFVRN